MKQAVIQTIFVFLVASSVLAQKKSVVIGESSDRPNAVLYLNPSNHDQGFLPPQLSTQQRLDVNPTSPDDDGLLVFDTDEKAYYHWRSDSWARGLSGDQLLNYNKENHLISLLPNGGSIDVSDLKEIPSIENNGGKYLTTDGARLLWASNAPRISYESIDPSDFMALKAELGSGNHATAIFQSDNTFITANDASVSTHQMAPVHIPHNAKILEVTVFYQDAEVSRNITAKLLRKKLDGSNDELFTWTSSGSSGGIQNQTITSFNGREIVDNSQYTYRMLIIFDLSGLVSLPGNAYQRIYGVRIKYQE